VIPVDALNAATPVRFVELLDGIFEHSPWVAERAAAARPFRSREDLHAALCAVVATAPRHEQMALIRAHPELAGRAAVRSELTAASAREQQGAGLDACTPQQFAQLQRLNAQYNERFGFPFILAVRGHDRAGILAQWERRLGNAPEAERAEALRQIERIARFRLEDLLGG